MAERTQTSINKRLKPLTIRVGRPSIDDGSTAFVEHDVSPPRDGFLNAGAVSNGQ